MHHSGQNIVNKDNIHSIIKVKLHNLIGHQIGQTPLILEILKLHISFELLISLPSYSVGMNKMPFIQVEEAGEGAPTSNME